MDHIDSKPRLSDLAEEEILQRIRIGELPAGSRLPSEPELAQQMGISRGILREALNSLQTRGYITRTPRGGSHISNPEASALSKNLMRGFMSATLAELINFREALETHAAMIVIRTASDEEIAHLRELTDYDAWREVTDAHVFHYRLMEMSGIPQYAHFIDFYFERFKSLADPTRCRIINALAMHERVGVCCLADLVGMTVSSVSHQLSILKLQRLVKSEKEGRNVFYSLSDRHVHDVFVTALEHVKE